MTRGREDNAIKIYRKSLLYLVSRAFEEGDEPAKILGMQDHNQGLTTGLGQLKLLYSDGLTKRGTRTASDSDSGFDNDIYTMNAVLRQILAKGPSKPFTKQSLKY